MLGRVTIDAVTTLGSGVDGSVRRIETAYDSQGNAYLITSYDAASGGNIVNQIQRAFNGLGQLTTEYQSHSGAVNTSTSPKVQYAWSEMASGANHSRLVTVTYPNGRTVTWDYGTSGGLDDTISRLAALKDGSTTMEGYSYLGTSTVVVRSHPQPDVDLTYLKRSGESNGDAGDPYIGLDRFGRVIDQRWVVASSGTATDRFQYTYDRDGNRTATTNTVNTAFNETYGYDNLNQLTSFARGSHTQSWDVDAVGNFESVTTDGGSAVTRTHNAQNELTGLGGSALTFDANGNTTTDETGKTLVYDAWNRLVAVKSGSTTLVSYQYDGLNRRIVENSGTARDLYYSSDWQVLEERVSGTAKVQYVWSPVYIDALVLRDRDADGSGGNGLEERFYAQQDGNWNVTALVNTSGTVTERFAYDPFGTKTVLDANWTTDADGLSDYDWVYLFQGRPLDSTAGNYDNRGRWYRATLGRPIQSDMLKFGAGDVNFYRWEGNTPVNRLDPLGLQARRSDTMDGRPIARGGPVMIPLPGAPVAAVTDEPVYPSIPIDKTTGVDNGLGGKTRLKHAEAGDNGTPEGKEAFWAGAQVITGGAALKGAKSFWAFMRGGSSLARPTPRLGPHGVDPAHHNANVMVRDPSGKLRHHERLVSGNPTLEEKALGFPWSMKATHTEIRAVNTIPLKPGETMIITGQKAPCEKWCQKVMEQAAKSKLATIIYRWRQDGITQIMRWGN